MIEISNYLWTHSGINGDGYATCALVSGIKGYVQPASTPKNTMVYMAQVIDPSKQWERQREDVGEYPTMLEAKHAIEHYFRDNYSEA